VAHALRTHDASGLRLLGHGEISLALGWPPDDPHTACKRLPPFRSLDHYRSYAVLVERYIRALEAGGTRVVETELRYVTRADGRVIGFHLQPALPPDSLGNAVLRRSEPETAHALIASVVDVVMNVTNDRVGIDSQLSTWSWHDGEPWQLDLTTPFLFDEGGAPELEMAPFLEILPAAIRPVVRRQMTGLMRRWATARGALADMAANAIKFGLDSWVDPIIEHINARVDPPLTRREAEKMYADDRRLFPVLLRLERANRWWQERVRRRPYEFLLPERTTYEEALSGW
jgi:hypothetical protein